MVRVMRWGMYALLVCGVGCDRAGSAIDADALAALDVPAALEDGARQFAARCAACHGTIALGTEVGPPLLHSIYRPAHHGDESFQLAARSGVRAHHWRFGDMAPVAGVTRDDVAAITAYVRWLQRAAGIE